MQIKVTVSNHPWRCIDEDGQYCPWIRTMNFGTVWLCALFHENDTLKERDGCLEKHPECIAACEMEV